MVPIKSESRSFIGVNRRIIRLGSIYLPVRCWKSRIHRSAGNCACTHVTRGFSLPTRDRFVSHNAELSFNSAKEAQGKKIRVGRRKDFIYEQRRLEILIKSLPTRIAALRRKIPTIISVRFPRSASGLSSPFAGAKLSDGDATDRRAPEGARSAAETVLNAALSLS